MKSMWRGQLGFGLVQIPVSLFKATEDHDVGFGQYCPHCETGRVGLKKQCKECQQPVEWTQTLRGHETEGGKVVFVTDDELDHLEQSVGKQIEILQFVDRSEIHPMMYEGSYFVGTDTSAKAYTLLTQAMAGSGLFAVAEFALRDKKQRAALEVLDSGHLVLHRLRWPDEVRVPEGVNGPGADFTAREMKTAIQVVESMVDKFDPDSWVDERQVKLRELIAAKAQGEDYDMPAAVSLDATVDDDVLAQLEASIKRHPAKGRKRTKRSVA